MIPNTFIDNKSSFKDDCSGLIANIQKFSIHDGPGIRTTVFMKGCSLRCQWCSNPETLNHNPQIMTFAIRCIRCENCINICPKQAIRLADGLVSIDWDKCDQCQKCAEVCPSEAIETIGKSFSCEKLLKEIASDRLFYDESGGGVTFSGGEPLVQWGFVLKMLKLCNSKSIHTCLDTTGNVSWGILEKIIPHVDLFLYDLKHLDAEPHKAGTGVDNTLILKNLSKLARCTKIWLRVPIIPEYNDSIDHIERIGRLAVNLGVEKVSLMPYHYWGAAKYDCLGITYRLTGLTPPTREALEKYKGILQRLGANVMVGK